MKRIVEYDIFKSVIDIFSIIENGNRNFRMFF